VQERRDLYNKHKVTSSAQIIRIRVTKSETIGRIEARGGDMSKRFRAMQTTR